MSKLFQTVLYFFFVVDVGCGNGKYLGHHQNTFQLGLDYSRNLLGLVQQNKKQEAVRSDVLAIPLRDGVADACISIAVIHHLSTKVSTYLIDSVTNTTQFFSVQLATLILDIGCGYTVPLFICT